MRLEHEVRGSGAPVVFVHGGLCENTFRCLLDRPELVGSHRLVSYHRAGYGGSDRLDGPVSVGDQAEHCRSLMLSLGIERADVVGHSSGANIALQLTLDHPDAVRSLALLETALLAVPTGPFAGEAIQRYRAGEKAAAADVWLRGVAGPGYREVLDRVVPGAFDDAVAAADTFFGQELPAVRDWVFGPDEASRIAQPTLVVLGARSHDVSPVFGERHELLLAWLPRAEPFVLPDATHLLHVQNPAAMATALADFLARA
ncbi:alpha/beta fold hydrolase [Cryptosporangium aurantiacum]|uniref:Pimeloyl-ACP methyl ester carboxylesterase n=1 Tax=Cryptosporangium aurantiacum TaxID=134849 RepID=A0A1M7RLN2_9ACTN|nr:alpha/beta hydrolase [Cryptosporangium aurantiacum]SHN47022.1 Pimeloyl-ACP methyl ester carboxylesterase [Cryptosporangium aurantiacum]